jgi:hypothetical protein
VQYTCRDILGNTAEAQTETDIVDTVAPEITKTMLGPYYGDCPPADGQDCYVDNATRVRVEAVDPDPHPVNDVTCDWSYEVFGTDITDGMNDVRPPFEIAFPEESRHQLTVICSDALGNSITDVEVFIADHTPPVTTKEYGQPVVYKDSGTWVRPDTNIMMTAIDPEPHPAGVASTSYRVTRVADEACASQDACALAEGSGNWNMMTEWPINFNIGEDSCHLIEYYSIDRVSKTEQTHRQCVYSDGKAPIPVKTVGQPKVEWNGEDGRWYGQYCNEFDCWKVTMTTPIDLACEDQQPHPVEGERTFYKVELDGDDWTAKYCSDYYNGQMTDAGYCEINTERIGFLFKEESEHKLTYYCEDALGNVGTPDVEYFKVEGTDFHIPLYKKWNMISVPFPLIDDNPDNLFGPLEGVESVWAYDSENSEWLVWTHDGPKTLTSIQPGWGYFVFEMNDEEWLAIGGSLMKPGVLPPSRVLEPGWNLIGYYGTQWQNYPQMEDQNFVCGDVNDPAQVDVFGSPVYCALGSLVDTQEGYPRWSSLWSYVNCGGHNAGWSGMNACGGLEDTDKMYAGRGYWVELDVKDRYAPASTCVWNDDLWCIEGRAPA